jgi:hypothetical protein
VNDVMSGWGRLEDPSGAFYEGHFLSGLKHGMVRTLYLYCNCYNTLLYVFILLSIKFQFLYASIFHYLLLISHFYDGVVIGCACLPS